LPAGVSVGFPTCGRVTRVPGVTIRARRHERIILRPWVAGLGYAPASGQTDESPVYIRRYRPPRPLPSILTLAQHSIMPAAAGNPCALRGATSRDRATASPNGLYGVAPVCHGVRHGGSVVPGVSITRRTACASNGFKRRMLVACRTRPSATFFRRPRVEVSAHLSAHSDPNTAVHVRNPPIGTRRRKLELRLKQEVVLHKRGSPNFEFVPRNRFKGVKVSRKL